MFIHIPFLILSLISTFHPSQGTKSLARQDSCDQTCDAVLPAIFGGTNSTTCTESIAQQYVTCLDCSLESGSTVVTVSMEDSQVQLDAYIKLCIDGGFPIKEPSLSNSTASATSSTPPVTTSASATKKNEATGNVGGHGIAGLVFLGVLSVAVVLHV
ncbi:hypothetical protein C8R44DRAFT_889393 [Mycena epipterygia]|nr:hypothetical protein C8R44DRAFT_889393 [Mycena epipterygia]